jgi:hypothetical protein
MANFLSSVVLSWLELHTQTNVLDIQQVRRCVLDLPRTLDPEHPEFMSLYVETGEGDSQLLISTASEVSDKVSPTLWALESFRRMSMEAAE